MSDKNENKAGEENPVSLGSICERLESDFAELQNDIKELKSLDDLNKLNKKYLGQKSFLTYSRSQISKAVKEQRAQIGKTINLYRQKFNEEIEKNRSELEKAFKEELLKKDAVDITLPTDTKAKGARHPLNALEDEIADIFRSLGWIIERGPEIEAQWFNFDSLNIAENHPARQMQDTFYIEGVSSAEDIKNFACGKDETLNSDKDASKLVMRTHTSPVQMRSLLKYGAPLYVASLGRVFRSDALDSTHTPVFNQCEGLAIDKGLTMQDMKGVLEVFIKRIFKMDDVKVRLRPSYFPFTEPSAELDVWFENKAGGSGWVEILGCGMVHPNVLLSAGIDPDVYSGYAFGIGIERTLQLRHGINSMRDIVEGDVKFSRQLGAC